ncbi:hypothetical protein QYF61_027252 [Mycteria americana]|uniref:G-protein coupled receptors family 3 profile domain-containing protein n=1 Tax=Mycteria americana TaxID=33587 RepID=A0AAN7MM33_MYCAM|nr:hypothetical protein QYF61_027252 [Mycteria americana]
MGPWRWLLLRCLHAVLVHGTILAGGQRPQERPPRPAGWSPAPLSSWAPTPEPGASGDPEGSAAALAFLRTGDARRLARANCSRGVVAGSPGSSPPPALRATLRAAPEALAQAANFLNMLFQTNDIREASVAEDVEWYQALVRSLAEGHPWVRRVILALDAHPLAAKPRLMLQATKGDGEILLQDISAAAPSLGNLSWDNEWFNALKSQRTPPLHKRVLSNDLRSMETPKWQRGDSYVGEPGHVWWSPPFLECRDGRFLPTWAVTLSSAFYGLKPDLSPEFKGVVRVDVELRDVAIDQCASGPGWFADTHRCDLNSTQPVSFSVSPRKAAASSSGRTCAGANRAFTGPAERPAVPGQVGAAGSTVGADGGSQLACRPCRQGCVTCEDDRPCLIQEDRALRAAVLSCQACCMLAVFLSMLVSYHFRRSKARRPRVLPLHPSSPALLPSHMQTPRSQGGSQGQGGDVTAAGRMSQPGTLGGISLPWLHPLRAPAKAPGCTLTPLSLCPAEDPGIRSCPPGDDPLRVPPPLLPREYPAGHGAEKLWVFILYFKPSIFRCIVLRWVRTLGFAIVYGTITLKLYRVLKVFLSRTAQRVPYVSSGRVLKMLGLILLLVLWFLAAWTIGMLENIDKNIPLVIRTQTAHGLHFYICGHDRWDYMMVIAEMLFLLWGSFLCYATRAMPSTFHEPRYMGIALHNELMISAAFHVVRFIMVPSLHPDWTLLLFFAHTHGTITMTLALLFIPKFLHNSSPLREEIAAEVYEDELDMRRSGSCLNSSITSAWSEHSLDPDDIREELKKLYMQLEVHKTWRMAANNPHLPKKRSSRRGLGRSIARRVAELPEAVARRSGRGERAGTPARRGSSANRLPDAGSSGLRTRDDGSRRRAAAPRKSRSTRDPAREPQGGSPTPGPPGEPASGRKTMAATASEQSDSESLDAAPLVCKSASAQNLAGRGQPPAPHAPPLQKSLSFIDGTREEALLTASRAAWEEWHANWHPCTPSSEHPTDQGPSQEAGKPQSPGAADGLPPAGSSPAEGCSQEDTSPSGDGKVPKHVTYAPIKSISVDSSHLPGRVRVTVRRTPPPPPLRHQSLVQRAVPAGESPEPLADPPARAGEAERTPEGPAEEESGRASSPVGKGRLLTAASIPAQVCPWELVQEEILSRKQKATEAADSGTPGDAAATPTSLKLPSQKTSIRGLGLAIKAFNRSRGKSILKGKREGEGSLRKRGHEREGGSRRERPSLAETAAVSLGGISRHPAAKSPEWSRQRPGSEPAARPWQGETVPCQHNNNAGTAWEAAGWGYGRAEAEGQRDRPAPGTGDGEKMAEEPSAPRGNADAGGGPGPPSGVQEMPPGVGHQEGAEHPCETPVVGGRGKAQTHPRQGAEAPAAEPEKDAPAAVVRPITAKEGVARPAEGLEAGRRSVRPQDCTELEQPHAKPVAGSPHPSTAGVWRAAAEKPEAAVCPLGIPAGKGTLLRQEAIASREESGVLLGVERVPAKSRSVEVAPGGKACSTASRQAEVCPGETQADSGIKIAICPWEESRGERWVPGRALGKGGSEGDPRLPGEEPGTEKPPAKSPELPQRASETAGSAEGRMAEVCPWESRDGGRTVRAEICPWDVEGAQPEQERQEGERRQLGKWVKSISPLSLLRAQESRSSLQAPSRPWGSTGSEGSPPKPAPRSSELPEVTSRSPVSTRASVCPWEAAGADNDAEEVCPWERGTALSNAGKLDDGEISQVKNGISPQRAAPRGTGETALAADKGSSQRGSPRPGEGAEQPNTGLTAKYRALLKTSSKQGGTVDSKKADICPWEVEDKPLPKAEICPWEESAAPSGKDRPSQDTRGISKGENKPGSGGLEDIKAKLAETVGHQPERRDTGIFAKLIRKSLECAKAESKKSQSTESIKEEVCPWESLGTEQPPEQPRARSPALPKSPSKKSQSVEGLKAEVCPWEAQKLEATDKAEICPWEAAAPPSDQPKAKQGAGGASKGDKRITRQAALASPVRSPEKGSSKRGAVCPWESLGMEQLPEQPRAGSPTLPKSPSKKSQSVESLKAEVCPWEAQKLEATNNAEICPWEAAVPPSSKEKSRRDKDTLSMVSRRPSTSQGLLKEIRDSTSAKKEKASKDRESICPWESTNKEGSSTVYGTRSTELLKATAKKPENVGSTKAEVCPWESLGMEQPPERPRARSPALPKSPSKKSQSVEVLKAEVCPWEAQKLEATNKAEICPWEVAAPPSGKEKSRQDKDILSMVSRSSSTSQGLLKEIRDGTSAKKEKASKDRESICPWESLGTEEPPEQPRAGSPTLPKSPSKKSQSVEGLKAEVCPWELEPRDKAEICPWEVAAPPSGKEKSRRDKDTLSMVSRSSSTSQGLSKETGDSTSAKKEKASRDRESICPWESLGTEEPSLKSAMGKEPSKKSDNMESRKSDICPWEAAEPTGLEKESFKPGVHPQGADRASPTWTGKSKPVAGASTVSPTALLKKSKGTSDGEAEHKPLCRILPGIQPSRGPRVEPLPRGATVAPTEGSSPSPGASVAEVCPWEAEEALPASDKTSTDTRKTSEVCPWEVESTDPTPTLRRQGRAGASPQDRGRGASETKSDVCPQDHE